MKKYTFLFSLFVTSIIFSQANTSKDPNIIFFIVDDLGYYDLAVYNNLLANGSKLYETPNIDALANEGVLFTHGYEAAPRCAASRTSIMSGKFESRPSVSGGLYLPSDNNANGYAETTFAQALKNQGYKTFFIGKWHLGHDENHYPDSFGFDINISGSDFGAPPTYWYPYTANGKTLPDLSTGGSAGEYLTDRITIETNSFIENHITSSPTQPFLAMVSHYGVHTPLEAKSTDVAYFQNKVNNTTYIGDAFENDLTAKTKLHQDNATYAAMIKSVDESLGEIRKKLKEKGIENNTIIIVTSDNGGLSTTEIGGNRELPTSNRPFRGGKTWLYEGGIRLPLIVYGPKYRSGVVEDEPVVGTDFFPTILEMGNTPLLPNQHLDGESFQDLLLTTANGGDASYSRKNPIIWDFNFASKGTANVSMAAARQGNYKLLEYKYNNVFELYDVVNDPSESTDLSASKPAIVKQLKTALFNYRSKAGINHRVTNSGHLNENKYLYDNMNAKTGSNIQPDLGCSKPNTSNSIIYNAGFECWYDLDWPITVNSTSEANLERANTTDVRTGDLALKINVIKGGGYGKVRVTNTPYYDDLSNRDITLSVYAKSNNNNNIRYQLKVNYADGSNKTILADSFKTSNLYTKYTYTFTKSQITANPTESVEVRLQLGKDTGEIFLDDWSSEVTGAALSVEIEEELASISVYPNPTSNFIKISGPLVVQKAYLFDYTGKLIKKSIGDVEKISVKELPKGVYLLKAFVEGNQYFTKKIIKE
ncbi:T9SS type A sorting domain-containing protein [Polaribacter aestuariivivens]|uniref:T9SS type A sorting domain-containing protein n=1 Tax=Polaribacter aestuariivivens TaxID=2304626 RepID=A0A5S3NBY5_9FLAO|nr:sulfatase-like hydrolase/transferase [Polaribacter aestuariivivens]TMM30456.1 T9SS type A sorting domain-containing protein [Polaribacter aestuariivivens]